MLRAMASCPICSKPAAPRARNPAAPFCSPRCRQSDLGKWLSEEYRVPSEEAPSDESEPTAATATQEME
jgi:endogenous inhibitor of DNA gyrase (YacG/DUF329 family)